MSCKLATRRHNPGIPSVCIKPPFLPPVVLPPPLYWKRLFAQAQFWEFYPGDYNLAWTHELYPGATPNLWQYQNPGYDDLLWLRVIVDPLKLQVRAIITAISHGNHGGAWTNPITIPAAYKTFIPLEPWIGHSVYQGAHSHISPFLYLLRG